MAATGNSHEAATVRANEGKYLTLSLAGERYGIGILEVREIIGRMPITPVPLAPSFLKGVINIRGKVIPVVDLRRKFGMPQTDVTEGTCIIVVQVKGGPDRISMGIVVDAVSEVLNIRASDMEPTPTVGSSLKSDYILGIGKMDGGIEILLDIDRVLSSEEIMALEQAA